MLHLLLALQLSRVLHDALAAFAAHRPAIEARVGKDQAIDLGMRLVTDIDEIGAPPPSGYTRAAWEQTQATVPALDAQAVAEVIRDSQPQLPAQSGLHEGFVRSSVDGLWEPIAVYIPPVHAAHPPLAIVLHGLQESETNLLGVPYLRALADRTGTILVAPWGRGIADFHGAAARDIENLVPLAERTYHSDPDRLYLVGYSMGGISVFSIGILRPWSAVMCISGTLNDDNLLRIQSAWRNTPVYVVNGSADEVIPAEQGRKTAALLASFGIRTSYYRMLGGTHFLGSLMPVLATAWTDMHEGIVRPESIARVFERRTNGIVETLR